MIVWTLMIQRNSMIPRYSITQWEISIESIDFNNPKVFSDTSIFDCLVLLDITVTLLICQNKFPFTSITNIVIVVTIVSSWRVDQIFFLSQEYISQSPQSRESDVWIQIIDTGNPISRRWPDIFPKVHSHQTGQFCIVRTSYFIKYMQVHYHYGFQKIPLCSTFLFRSSFLLHRRDITHFLLYTMI